MVLADAISQSSILFSSARISESCRIPELAAIKVIECCCIRSDRIHENGIASLADLAT